jgi:hypothetical protein
MTLAKPLMIGISPNHQREMKIVDINLKKDLVEANPHASDNGNGRALSMGPQRRDGVRLE